MDPLRSANHTAITAVTVIDPWRREVTAGQTVVVGGGTISAVGGADEVPVPSNAVLVDGRGRFLIPGLWDMHVHGAADDLSLYLVSGVTGVREMGPAPAALPIRDDIVAGRLLGPRIIIGDPVDGPDSVVNWVRTAGDVESAGAAVKEIAESTADFVKVFSFLPRDAYLSIAEETRRRGMRFGGHVPYSVTVAEAATAGQWTIEHLTSVLQGVSDRETELLDEFATIRRPSSSPLDWVRLWLFQQAPALLQSQRPDRLQRLIDVFGELGTWHVPTLVILRDFRHFDDLPHQGDPRRRWVGRDQFFAGFAADLARTIPDHVRSAAKAQYALELEIVGQMHSAGIGLLAGTDNPPSLPQGASLHDELSLLVEAGLPPMEALRAATTNPAIALGIDNVGRIERGASADLVLLDGDPLSDIHNTQRIHAVFAAGRLLDRAALDTLIAERVAASAAAS